MQRQHLKWLVSGLVIGSLVSGGVAIATIPHSTTGEITACVKTAGAARGAVRIIDAQAGATCARNETRITWDSTKLSWRGDWSATVQYAKGDIVVAGGSSFIARSANRNVAPSNTTTWGLVARVGATGPQGETGPPGPRGPRGEPGPGMTHLNELNGIGCWFEHSYSGYDVAEIAGDSCDGATLPAGGTCVVSVRVLEPLGERLANASFAVASLTVPITTSTTGPLLANDSPVDVDNSMEQPVYFGPDEPIDRVFTFSNIGGAPTAPLQVTFTASNGALTKTADTCDAHALPVGESCIIVIHWTGEQGDGRSR